MLELLDFLLPKNKFRLFGTEMTITKKLQYKIQMLEMLNPCFTIDENIIKEDQHEVLQVGTKYFIHQCLEHGRGICESKWHDQKFIMAIVFVEICSMDIICMDPNLVIPKMSTMELIQNLINNGNCKLILDCDMIKCSKIDGKVP